MASNTKTFQCDVCGSDNPNKLMKCGLCKVRQAHDACAKNEKLAIDCYNKTRMIYFCKSCHDDEAGIQEVIKVVETRLEKEETASRAAKEKEKEEAALLAKERTNNSEKILNTQSVIQLDSESDDGSQGKGNDHRIPVNRFNAVNVGSNSEFNLNGFENLNLNRDITSSPANNNNNMRGNLHSERDYNLELEKRKKEVNDATQQFNELIASGQSVINAQLRLNVAIGNLVKLHKPTNSHASLTAASQQANVPSAPPSEQDSNYQLFSKLKNDVLNCAICRQMITKKENSIKCSGCSVLVHTECGFNYGEVELGLMSTGDVIFHCRRCINKRFYEQSQNNNANNNIMRRNIERESIDTILTNINVPTTSEALNLTNVHERSHNNNFNDVNNSLIVENMSRTLEEMTNEKMRKEWKILPVVTNEGLSWKHFYEAYQDSKRLFKPYVNAQRIRDAIKCDAVKEKGGENLFHKDTCDDTIEFLNNLYEDSTVYMLEKLKSLLSSKINHAQDYDSVLKYLIKALNFTTLQSSIGNSHSGHHQEWMTRIIDKLPFEHKVSWQKLCYEKHKLKSHENFHDLEIFLKDTISYVNMVKREHMFFSATIKTADTKNNKSNPNTNRNRNTFNNTQNVKEPWDYKCWVCQKDDHFIRDCKVSHEKDGKELFAIASKLKICTLCGKEKYIRGKPCTGQKTPSECRKCPGKKHWATVCPLRKGSKSNFRTNEPYDNKKKPPISNNQKEFHSTKRAIEYQERAAIDYTQKPMIMPPPNPLNNTTENLMDFGSEFVVNGSNNLHQNNPPDQLNRWYLNAKTNVHMLEQNVSLKNA